MRRLTSVGSVVIVLFAASASHATVITSADFSFGFGATALSPATWTATENAATNTPATIDNFSFAPLPVGGRFSGTGPKFVGRVLANGSTTDVVGYLKDFSVPITASYNGPAPSDASATPDYKLLLEITKISLYGARSDATSGSTLAWSEVTSGHSATSPSIALTIAAGAAQGSKSMYKQLAWDPADYEVSLTGLNGTFTRTFGADAPYAGTGDWRLVDGMEIEGRVHLSYNAVPEPAAVVLLATSLIGLLAYAWRKKK